MTTSPRLTGHLCSRAGARFLALLVFILGLTCAGFSQQITGSIVGTVKDPQGAVVSSAQVKATNTNTGFTRSAPTNGYGEFRIDYLPVGNYTVEASAANFKTFIQKNVVLTVDQTQTLGITLEIGAQTQTVTVTEAPPLVDTSDAELGRTISAAEITGLPLVNRNAYAELSLTPGVMANSMSQQSNPSGTPNFVIGLPSTDVQVNGSIDGGNPEVSFYLDGGLNINGIRNYGNQLPNPDALEEFRVETSDFSAQYGHMSAAVVTAVTKSGTNQLHGSLFEFNRNTDFNAYNWNAPKDLNGNFIKAPYHRNQFGGVLGGPVKKDKAFFFFSYGGLRQVVGQYVSGGRMPTAAERLGDFTQDLPNPNDNSGKYSYYHSTPFTINMPGTKTHYTGQTNSSSGCPAGGTSTNPTNLNCLPATTVGTVIGEDAIAAAVLGGKNANASIPLPNAPLSGSTANLQWIGYFTGPTDDNEYLAKYDQVLSDKDHVAATYFFVRTTQNAFGGGNVAPWTINQSYTNQTNANVSDIHTFSATTANQAWLSYTRAAGGRVNLPAGISAGTLGSNYTIQGPATIPDLNVSGYFHAQDSLAGPVTASDFYSLRDMVTMTKGKHSLFYGGEFALDKGMFVGNLYNYGNFSYASSAPTTTGNALADFYTGMLSSMEQDTPYHTLESAWHTGIFFQDNYRITPRFTANLGVRWDIDTAPVESSNLTAAFIPSKAGLTSSGGGGGTESTVIPIAPEGMFFPGDPGVGRGIVSTKYHHVAPRIGFAWDPFGDGKTAIRMGAGVFYGTTSGNEWNQPGNANPYAVRQTFGSVRSASDPYNPLMVNGTASAFPNGDPFPYTFNPKNPRFLLPASIESIGVNAQWPYIYQFNLAVQRQLPWQVALTAAYVGTLSRDIPTMVDGNYAPYVAGISGENSGSSGTGGYNARRPYDQNSTGTGTLGQNIFLITNQTASYHSLQVSAGRPLSRNLMVNGFYVWSHAIQSSNESAIGQMTAQDFANLWEEKGPMDADRRNVATLSGTWNIDYYRGNNFLMKQVVNGWTISPVWVMQSGSPFSVTTGSDKNDDSANANRPDFDTVNPVSAFLDPHRPRAQAAAEWFNTAAFVNNGPGIAGGIGPGGADGNVPRDYMRNPGYRDVDLGLFRDFRFAEGITLQVRGESTNALNLVSLSGPGTSGPPPTDGQAPSSSGFGVITAASSPRIIQVGARLTF
ncbi:MAG TPA: carboxypeptidase-like regulatory domain-containing protein [Terracidiphilus sp.]|nr:carboxypeptidase-like regulatory domain-containing protein [Terracidiphilus sp.]